LGDRGRRISELEASLSSRTARAIQRNPVLKKKKQKKKKKKKEKKEKKGKKNLSQFVRQNGEMDNY
jgi:hypothetical protein